MKKNKMESAEMADMMEMCNLLINNGYRLIRIAEDDTVGGCALDCCVEGEVAAGSSDRFGGMSAEAPEEDQILAKEIQRAYRRAELIRLELSVNNPELVSALRRWRREKAAELHVPAYCVLANEPLLMTAIAAPATLDELLSVKGIGPVLAEKYGLDILDVVARVMEEVK